MKAFLTKLFAPMPGRGPHSWHPALFYEKMAALFVCVCLFLGLLHILPRQYRKWIITAFTFVGGLYFVAEFFMPATGQPSHNALTDYNDLVANMQNVVGSFAIGVGVFSLLQLHFHTVAKARTGWGNSIALIVSFVAMFIFGLMDQYAPEKRIFGHTTADDIFKFLFTGGLNNLGSAMFSIIAFFIASAAYRAFRIRSVESSLLMLAALIVMLGSVSFGVALTGWVPATHEYYSNFRIERVAQWLMLQINSPAQRGILFGLTIGSLAVSLRLWLSLERGGYFDQEL